MVTWLGGMDMFAAPPVGQGLNNVQGGMPGFVGNHSSLSTTGLNGIYSSVSGGASRWDRPDVNAPDDPNVWGNNSYSGVNLYNWYDLGGPESGQSRGDRMAPTYQYTMRDSFQRLRDAYAPLLSGFASTGQGFTSGTAANVGRFLGSEREYNFGGAYDAPPENMVTRSGDYRGDFEVRDTWGTSLSGLAANLQQGMLNPDFASNSNLFPGLETIEQIDAVDVESYGLSEQQSAEMTRYLDMARVNVLAPEAREGTEPGQTRNRPYDHKNDIYPELLSWMVNTANTDEGLQSAISQVDDQWMYREGMGLDISQTRLEELQAGPQTFGTGMQLTSAEKQLAGLFLEDISPYASNIRQESTPGAQSTRRYMTQTPESSSREMRTRAFSGGPRSRTRGVRRGQSQGSLLGRSSQSRSAGSSLLGSGSSSLGGSY